MPENSDPIYRLINNQLSVNYQTLNIFSQSISLLSNQQRAMNQLVECVIARERSNNYLNPPIITPRPTRPRFTNSYRRTESNTEQETPTRSTTVNSNAPPNNSNNINTSDYLSFPVSLSINSISLSDLSENLLLNNNISSNSIDIHPILQNILGLVDNDRENSTNEINVDISACTIEKSYGEIDNPTSLICPISLETFSQDDVVLQIRRCNHYFKKSSLTYWFRLSKMCPVCRRDVTQY